MAGHSEKGNPMYKRIYLFGIFFLASLISLAAANENIAVVIKLEGEVRVTPANSMKSEKVQKGQILKDGDKLETGAASFCALKFLDDKSLLRIKEKSSCVIEGKRNEKSIEKNIFVEAGTFFLSLFRQDKTFKVTTPTSVASVKGTKWWIIQALDTRYVVIDGAIQLDNNAGKVLVRKGQTGIVSSRNQMPEVRLTRSGDIPSDELDEGSLRSLDFEFNNSSGQTRVLRVRIKSRD